MAGLINQNIMLGTAHFTRTVIAVEGKDFFIHRDSQKYIIEIGNKKYDLSEAKLSIVLARGEITKINYQYESYFDGLCYVLSVAEIASFPISSTSVIYYNTFEDEKRGNKLLFISFFDIFAENLQTEGPRKMVLIKIIS